MRCVRKAHRKKGRTVNRAERLTAILDLVAGAGQIDIAEIVDSLGVSAATARRDLDTLAEQQLLTRTHGGAVGQAVSYDLPLRYRRNARTREKELIARVASALVRPGDTVGLCGGTTATAVAGALATRPDLATGDGEITLTIVTNAINIAAELAVRAQFKVVVTGGVVQARSYELVGPLADAVLAQVSPTIMFLSVNGLDPVFGASMTDEKEAYVAAAMSRRSLRTVVVTDSDKIGVRAFAQVGGGLFFDTIITDAGISDAARAEFETAGIAVVIGTD